MTDDLHTRIAAVVYRHTLFRALDQCECGASFDGFCGRALDAYAAHVADAVIRELEQVRREFVVTEDMLRLPPPDFVEQVYQAQLRI